MENNWLIDFSQHAHEFPGDVAAAVAAGEPVVARGQVKRMGQTFEDGDVLPDFGQYGFDIWLATQNRALSKTLFDQQRAAHDRAERNLEFTVAQNALIHEEAKLKRMSDKWAVIGQEVDRVAAELEQVRAQRAAAASELEEAAAIEPTDAPSRLERGYLLMALRKRIAALDEYLPRGEKELADLNFQLDRIAEKIVIQGQAVDRAAAALAAFD